MEASLVPLGIEITKVGLVLKNSWHRDPCRPGPHLAEHSQNTRIIFNQRLYFTSLAASSRISA